MKRSFARSSCAPRRGSLGRGGASGDPAPSAAVEAQGRVLQACAGLDARRRCRRGLRIRARHGPSGWHISLTPTSCPSCARDSAAEPLWPSGSRRWTTKSSSSASLVIGELQRGADRIRRRDASSAHALDRWLRVLTTQVRGTHPADHAFDRTALGQLRRSRSDPHRRRAACRDGRGSRARAGDAQRQGRLTHGRSSDQSVRRLGR